MSELLGSNLIFDPQDFWRLLARLVLNLAFTSILVFGVYYRKHHNREYVFTCALINLITFLVCFLLRKVPVELGFALGLFAVFSILRYRTEPIRIRDLTYLFVAIGLAIVNAVFNKKTSVAEVLLVNTAVVAAAALLEMIPLRSQGGSYGVLYDNVHLLAPGREAELRKDLQARTGLVVEGVRVERIDLLRDAAEIVVHFAARAAEPAEATRSMPRPGPGKPGEAPPREGTG